MNIIKIENDNLVNGPGIRTVVWVAGCRHNCCGCHNPETWDFNSGEKYSQSHLNLILTSVGRDHISGITISGGDPLDYMNITEVREICKAVKKNFPEKSVWVYTGGLFEDYRNDSIMEYIDVIVDGEFINDLKNKPKVKWRGSSNQRIIDVKKSLSESTIITIE